MAVLTDKLVEIFKNKDTEALAALYREDGVLVHPFFPEPLKGRDAIRQAEDGLFAAFDDVVMEVKTVVESGPIIAAELVVGATHTQPMATPDGNTIPATGKRLELPMSEFWRLDDDGRIAEEHRYLDTATMMAQLGLGPEA